MLILTHQGPGYRSPLMSRARATDLGQRLQASGQYIHVRVLESTRARHPQNRYYVTCIPDYPEKQGELLTRLQQERIERAEKEGPGYLWQSAGGGLWYVLTSSEEPYRVDPQASTCGCRDYGVCADNGLVCKHLVAFQRGLGVFVTAELHARLQLLQEKLGQPPAPREPVALPVDLPAAA